MSGSAMDALMKGLLHRLAASHDGADRARAVRAVGHWVRVRKNITHMDYSRMWRGLFYCFWMSDKVPVQQELAANMSNMLLPPMPRERSVQLLEAFLETIQREWTSIDQLRMDKFMTLVRRFVHRGLLVLAENGWELAHAEEFIELFLDGDGALSHTTNQRGFFFHVTDVWLSEIERAAAESAKKGAPQLSFQAFDVLLTPFYHVLAMCGDESMVERTQKEIFEPLIELCKPVPASAAQRDEGSNGEEEDQSMEDSEEEEDAEQQQHQQQEDSLASQYPHIAAALVGYSPAIANTLRLLASADDEEIRSRSRKLLYAYAARFDAIESDAAIEEELREQEELEQAEKAAAAAERKRISGTKEGKKAAAAAAAASAAAATAKTSKKRKAESSAEEDEDAAESDLAPGVGSEGLQALAASRAKKRNKKQRLADKKRKKEAILGAEPAQSQAARVYQQQKGSAADADDDDDDDELDGLDAGMLAGADAEEDDYDGMSDEEGAEEYEEDEGAAEDSTPVLAPKLSAKEAKRLAAALQKEQQAKASKPKRHIVPIVQAEDKEEEEAEPAPAAKPKSGKKKQKNGAVPAAAASPVAAAPALAVAAATPSSPSRGGPSTPSKKQRNGGPTLIPAPDVPVAAPAVAAAAFHTPQPAKKSVSHTGAGGGAATCLKSALTSAVAPPSSTKKNVQIMLSHNKVKQFKRWSRDTISVETDVLLAKPSPKSAIKPESIEFFLRHNKNGRELAAARARQATLAEELNGAATTGSESTPKKKATGRTPPVSPRAKAADFF